MTTNLLDRQPVPGSLGIAVAVPVQFHLSTTGTIAQNTVTVTINAANAILLGAFQAGFSGSLTSDGAGGWLAMLNHTTAWTYNANVTVAIVCTEQPGSVAFSQSYTFKTARNIAVDGSVTYYEEGDVVEADLFVHEGTVLVNDLLDSATFKLTDGLTTFQTVQIDNGTRTFDAEGFFKVRLMHPPVARQGLRWEFDTVIDGYGAPGIGSVNVGGLVNWVARNRDTMLGAQQPSIRIGETVPRIKPAIHEANTVPESQPAYEVIDLAASKDALVEPTVLVDLNLLSPDQYLVQLTGDLTYTGGGHRLLVGIDDVASFFHQDADELAPTFGARALAEPQAINLLAASDLSTNPFTLSAHDPTVRVDTEIIPLTGSINQAHYTVEGAVLFDGQARSITLSTQKVPISPSSPVLVSLLARNELRDDLVTLGTFTIKVKLFDASNVLVYTADFNYDAHALQTSQFNMLDGLIAPGSIPGSASKASFDLVMGSWEGCDLMNLWLAAPSIEQASFTTSPVVGTTAPTTRTPDRYLIEGPGNLNCRTGQIAIAYAPQFAGNPPVDTTLWDTRSASFLSGYTLRHRADGKFEFKATDQNSSTTTVVSSTAHALVAGQPVMLEVAWSSSAISVRLDNVQVAGFTGSYAQPPEPQATISIGSRIDGAEVALAELHTFEIFGN